MPGEVEMREARKCLSDIVPLSISSTWDEAEERVIINAMLTFASRPSAAPAGEVERTALAQFFRRTNNVFAAEMLEDGLPMPVGSPIADLLAALARPAPVVPEEMVMVPRAMLEEVEVTLRLDGERLRDCDRSTLQSDLMRQKIETLLADQSSDMVVPTVEMSQALQDHMEQHHGVCLKASEWDAAVKAMLAASPSRDDPQ